MKELALHYQKTRDLYTEDKLVILFDIDGTILDMRYMILHVLKSFDQNCGTRFFEGLKLRDIKVHENQIEKLLAPLNIPEEWQERILRWYKSCRWSSPALLASHRPFAGVMEVIRWFQMQPNTLVALNTGRPESLRADTLRSLNKLGEEYKVHFINDLLFMNPNGWGKGVSNVKAATVTGFRKGGYRVFAMVDNEPDNLSAVSQLDPNQEILLLHADTIFESKRRKLPSGTVSGKIYDITELIHERTLPQHIQFVWHGVNDEANLRQFFASNIQWAESDIRLDPSSGDLILRHDSFNESPLEEGEELVFLEDVLRSIQARGKSIKLDLKENGTSIHRMLELVGMLGFDGSHLWFNGSVDVLREEGFRILKEAYPSAIIQCPIDHIVPLILGDPNNARDILSTFKGWGINRFSVQWSTPHMRKVLDFIDRMGFEANIYDVPDLEAFLKTVLLMPRSITSDFNFPEWHYFGRGSGQKNQHYEYSITRFPQTA
jgi:hypothetical protein